VTAPGRRTLDLTVVTLAKAPVPGRVKTRLCPPCSADQAAGLARAALADTLAAVSAAPVARRVLVLDGVLDHPVPAGHEVIPQRGDGLDQRLAHAVDDVADQGGPSGGRPVLVVGMDTPQLTPELVVAAGRRLLATDAVLGPARDGGFWALGMHRPSGDLVRGVPMSRPSTGAAQLHRLHAAGLRVDLLPTLADVDTATDAAAVASLAPGTAFARAWAVVEATLEGEVA
jgi:rSAM/selenodomain-associated transferase 1